MNEVVVMMKLETKGKLNICTTTTANNSAPPLPLLTVDASPINAHYITPAHISVLMKAHFIKSSIHTAQLKLSKTQIDMYMSV